jgi:hypothetical protein
MRRRIMMNLRKISMRTGGEEYRPRIISSNRLGYYWQ